MSVTTLERDRLSDLATMKVLGLRGDLEHLLARKRAELADNANPVLIVFIVSIAVLLALAAIISLAVVIYCHTKGMNFQWYVKTSWFTVKVACSR